MKKILIPFDFSQAAFNAVHHAIRIAQKTDAQITFLCRRQLPVMVDEEPGPDGSSLEDKRHPLLLWALLQNMLQALDINEKPNQVCYLFRESLQDDLMETVLAGSTYDLMVIGMEMEEKPFSDNHRIVQRVMDLPIPVLVIPHTAASQSVGTISLVTESLQVEARHALSVLLDLTGAFRAHLQVIHVGGQQGGAYAFRQAVKRLGLASRLDVAHHTYHFVQPFPQRELEELIDQSNTNWLVLFKYCQANRPEKAVLRHWISQSRVPLLLLPFKEEVIHGLAAPAVTREKAVFADAY